MSSLTCEISGEMITSDAVVTPSGHICSKPLLMTKLADTGGRDPFDESKPLTESDLIPLRQKQSHPPRIASSNIGSLLQQLQQEYQALVLELVDTRKELQETRQELSAALYQNDAAVRVIARLQAERDAARSNSTSTSEPPQSASNKKRRIDQVDAVDDTTPSDGPLENDIPAADKEVMTETWKAQNAGRKAKLKSTSYPSKEQLQQDYTLLQTPAWHKSSCRGIMAMSGGATLVTAGKDKQIVVYDASQEHVVTSMTGRAVATAVDYQDTYVVAGYSTGDVDLYRGDGTLVDSFEDHSSAMQQVLFHPDKQHVLCASESGRITICRYSDSALEPVAVLKPTQEVKLTTGALHPDGLIYLSASAFGDVAIWDLAKATVAGTLAGKEQRDAVTAVAVSPNGYHVCVSHESGKVRVWDLRKQSVLAELNDSESENALKTVQSVTFDPAGKYVAFGGPGGIHVVTVKEWDKGVVTVLECQKVNSIVWSSEGWLAAANEKNRKVGFFGKKE